MDRGNDKRASKGTINKPIRPCEAMKWIISFTKSQSKRLFALMIKWLDGE